MKEHKINVDNEFWLQTVLDKNQKMHCVRCLNRSESTDTYDHVNMTENDNDIGKKNKPKKPWPRWKKILFISGLVLFGILLLAFIGNWVIFPLVFMNNISLQRYFMFMNIENPKNPDFHNPEKYGNEGILNFYKTTVDLDNSTLVSIGAWMILPEKEKTTRILFEGVPANETVASILRNTKSPIALYLHGVGVNRILNYDAQRKHFLVIALDHRGFGDSAPNMDPSELGIVSDTTQIYRWVRSLTDQDIYIWGHSLGTALSTHTVKKLKENHNIVPKGLILESPFTTMREEVATNIFGQIFGWLAYFEQTVQKPLENNGFLFRTSKNILSVDCPILIMHAEDDNVVPFKLGKKLSEIAQTRRNPVTQGNVTFHSFPALLRYSHNDITKDPEVPRYIKEFKAMCVDQNKMRG
ncbi:unnamed protein product [Phaedon cochleariae]|uniref:AB hydrolase-1 domain-containing protein n=1 Tax=Phaedon cochleariae TaxID=80249 RepID=A0A9P0DG48_PHACE|nr:unnamed protein product [Phaedon cochleariae]